MKKTGETVPCPLPDCDKTHEIRVDSKGRPYVNCGKWKQNIWFKSDSFGEEYLESHRRRDTESERESLTEKRPNEVEDTDKPKDEEVKKGVKLPWKAER